MLAQILFFGDYCGLCDNHIFLAITAKPPLLAFSRGAQRVHAAAAAAERSLSAAAVTDAADTCGFSIVDAHIHLWVLTQFPVPFDRGRFRL